MTCIIRKYKESIENLDSRDSFGLCIFLPRSRAIFPQGLPVTIILELLKNKIWAPKSKILLRKIFALVWEIPKIRSISSRGAREGNFGNFGNLKNFKRPPASPRFALCKPLENVVSIIMNYSEINFDAPKMFFCNKIKIFWLGDLETTFHAHFGHFGPLRDFLKWKRFSEHLPTRGCLGSIFPKQNLFLYY